MKKKTPIIIVHFAYAVYATVYLYIYIFFVGIVNEVQKQSNYQENQNHYGKLMRDTVNIRNEIHKKT